MTSDLAIIIIALARLSVFLKRIKNVKAEKYIVYQIH